MSIIWSIDLFLLPHDKNATLCTAKIYGWAITLLVLIFDSHVSIKFEWVFKTYLHMLLTLLHILLWISTKSLTPLRIAKRGDKSLHDAQSLKKILGNNMNIQFNFSIKIIYKKWYWLNFVGNGRLIYRGTLPNFSYVRLLYWSYIFRWSN